MVTQESLCKVRELDNLNRLYDYLKRGDDDNAFFLRKETLNYAKKNAAFIEDSSDSVIIHLCINGDKMTIIISKKPTEYCRDLYPIQVAFLDSNNNMYNFVPDSTSVCNF